MVFYFILLRRNEAMLQDFENQIININSYPLFEIKSIQIH